MKITQREMPLHVLLDWLDNWGRWLNGRSSASMPFSDVGDMYENPGRNHHEVPAARIRPIVVHEWAASIVESAVHGSFPLELFAAVRAAHVTWPNDKLRGDCIAAERWDGKRARAASQQFGEYRTNIGAAYARLSRELYPWRHSMPVAA